MVNTVCAVTGCHKFFYPGCGISFHRLPSNAETRKKWLALLPGKTHNSVICSLHFKPEDYLTEALKRLKPGVVPTVFPKVKPVTRVTQELSKIAKKNVQLKGIISDPNAFGCEKCYDNINDGRLYRCVQCPDMLLCAECETDVRHQEHCVMRFPSRRIYDKVKQIFECLQEEIGEILTIKDHGINPGAYDDDQASDDDQSCDDVEMKPSQSTAAPPSNDDPSSGINTRPNSTESAEAESRLESLETDCDEPTVLVAKVETGIEPDPLDLPHSSQTDNRARKRKCPQPPQTQRLVKELEQSNEYEITVKEELVEEEVHLDESFDDEIKMEPPDGDAGTSDQAHFTMYGSHEVDPEDT